MRKYYRSPICRSCDKKLVYLGALLFSDPTDDDWEEMISPNVQKTHLCSKCYKNIIYAIDGGRFRNMKVYIVIWHDIIAEETEVKDAFDSMEAAQDWIKTCTHSGDNNMYHILDRELIKGQNRVLGSGQA